MKKIVYSFVLVLVSSLCLISCGSDNDDDVPVSPITENHMDNGHNYVDLGLPSGLKWATCNVGADKPEDYGDYFAWGETEVKSDYSWDTYAWGSAYQFTKYCTDTLYGKDSFIDSLTTLELVDDAAHVNWGGQWRMPTKSDFEELLDNTFAKWVDDYNCTGVSGYRFNASNGNHIFFPASRIYDGTSLYVYEKAASYGSYWLSSLYTTDLKRVYVIYFDSNKVREGNAPRYCGRPVRAVHP